MIVLGVFAVEVEASPPASAATWRTPSRTSTAVCTSMAGRAYTLRVTHIYRYDNGEWKIVHRHGDRLRKVEPGFESPEDRRDQGEIMPISLFAVVVDCRDPQQLAHFWSNALQWRSTRRNEGEFQVSDPERGRVSLYFMSVPEPKVISRYIRRVGLCLSLLNFAD